MNWAGARQRKCRAALKREPGRKSFSMRHVAVGQPARNRSEDAIQRAIIRHLETRAAPNTFWFHVPNGGYRRPAEAKILKSLGVVRGTPDLCFVKDGRAYFLELKAPGRPLSPAQEEVLIKPRDCGAIATHAHGLDQALAWLQARGLLKGEVQ